MLFVTSHHNMTSQHHFMSLFQEYIIKINEIFLNISEYLGIFMIFWEYVIQCDLELHHIICEVT
jgi:hypothetical protein